MQPLSALAAAFACAALPAVAADLSGARVEYVGGTLSQVRTGTQGRIRTTDPLRLVFEYKGTKLEVPYDQINLLEYGQQAGRRYVLALAISPLLLLSKSRKHFLTISYTSPGGGQQAMVLRVDKNGVRALVAGLEARTGLKVDYQDGEARTKGGG